MRTTNTDHIGSYCKQYLSQSVLLDSLRLHQVFETECMDRESIASDGIHGTVLLFCISGNGVLCADKPENSITLEKNTIVACSAGKYRELMCTEPENPVHCVGIVFSTLNTVASHSSLNVFYDGLQLPLSSFCKQGLNDFFSCLIGELMMSQTSLMVLNGLVDQILVVAYRAFSSNPSLQKEEVHSVNVVGHTAYAIIRYVDEHLFTMNNLMDMAKELGYSYNYLSHLFRRKTGMTIQSYVSQKKIEKSIELLSDERLSITEIASVLNYDCIQSFSKAFRRAMNMSPTEYRALHGLESNE